ncbi:SCO family protein [Rhodocyclaceae bacterium]
MFIKIVIVLLLLIVAASLLTGRGGTTRQAAAPSRVRPMMQKMAIILLALGAAIVIVHLTGCNPTSGTFHATEVKDANYGRLATLDGLTDHSGRRLASADFLGKAVVVFFGYTQCPDICPTALANLKETLRLLGQEADRVKVLFVTVDPERDTQEVLAGYVPWFDPRFLGLRTDTATTLDLAKEFRVYFRKVEGGSAIGYNIDHTAASYAFDPQGRLRLLIRDGTSPEHIAADLKQLLSEK